jgi:hypothetical protein
MTDTFHDAVADEDLAARRAAVEQIAPLFGTRQGKHAFEREEKTLDPSSSEYGKFGHLRRWLTDHEGERLYDVERGLVAYLQDGGSTDGYATASEIKERDEALYRHLEELGCLSLDATMVKARVASGHLGEKEIEPFKHRLARSQSLKVEKVKED